MESNIKKYKYHLFLKSCIWYGPILTLFYLLKTMSFTQIFLIASIYRVALAIFEVPTGSIADKFGYKKSVTLGLLVTSVALGIYPLGTTMMYFILCEILFAIGAALISGADESLFYDSLKKENREKEYQKLIGKSKQFQFLSQLIGSVLSAILFEINYMFPFLVSSILLFLGFILFSTFKEEKVNKKESQSFKEYCFHIKESGQYIMKNKKIRTIILFAGVVGMTYGTIHLAYAPFF